MCSRSNSCCNSNESKCKVTVEHLKRKLTEEQRSNAALQRENYLLQRDMRALRAQLSALQAKSALTALSHTIAIHTDDTTPHVDMKQCIADNTHLRQFKQRVYELSKQYDEINETIITALTEMEAMFARVRAPAHTALIEQLSPRFTEVMTAIVHTMKLKQDEYVLLLQEKENTVNAVQAAFRECETRVAALAAQCAECNEHAKYDQHDECSIINKN